MTKQKLTRTEKQILTVLLDAYERKSSGSSRRTILKADKFRDYDLNQIDKKKHFIASVKSLADRGMIQFEWKKFEKDNLLERIILLEEGIESTYHVMGRLTKNERMIEFLDELDKYGEGIESHWINSFLSDEEVHIRSKSSWSAIWPKSSLQREEFVTLLKVVDEKQDKSMRYLSVRLYGDSKKLEKQYKSKLISVARKYIPLKLEDGQILEYLGIMLNPSEILVFGPMEYTLNGKRINTSDCIFGTSINKLTVESLCDLSIKADRVLTIENKATYYEYIKTSPENVFVIYLGGFFGSAANRFLSKLNMIEDLNFYHWSDIDLGGLRIYRHLSTLLSDKLRPVGMEPETYIRYLDKYIDTDQITDKQLDEIKEMINNKEMMYLHETMKEVLRNKRRMEQECIEISDFERMFSAL